ncbi:flagellin/flagellar hook associated protein [Desulfosporosinus orientis DSM 765]|uniref:Flagellin n=1 Tax=Desulfosporosinus orientis (strain ATCC 19365 / DSM 765 / NCIMB 8382 / VKM B-1628 / Singapore I) TaxID=768706 RepID=G7WI14_DESOD|nr:flagellin [Desulfosporosinus orientis]AET70311.1 flagellin/flagellar hook associated protein [Desulfosporosinus orientis DSM 765]
MIINHNMSSLNTLRQMGVNEKNTSSSLEKLSSGLRINRAGDDAAGLAISEKMRGQIRGLDQASRNAQDSISMIQTAEGGLNETHSILQRMRELAVQASTDTNTETDRQALQDEMKQLTNEIDRIAGTTEFNTKKLLNGDLQGATDEIIGRGTYDSTFANGSVKLSNIANVSMAGKTDVIHINVISGASISTALSSGVISFSSVLGNITASNIKISGNTIKLITTDYTTAAAALTISIVISNATSVKAGDAITISIRNGAIADNGNKSAVAQIGANAGQVLRIGISAMDSLSIGVRDALGNALDLSTQKNADGAISLVNNAIEKVSTERSKLGALQNRLEHTINNLGTSSENVTAAESRIRDVDMAKEMTTFQKNNILNQAAQAMLAQANQQPQGVLQLLR